MTRLASFGKAISCRVLPGPSAALSVTFARNPTLKIKTLQDFSHHSTPRNGKSGETFRNFFCQWAVWILFAAVAATPLIAQSRGAGPSSDQAVRAKIEHYLRERYSIPPSSAVTVGELLPSIFPGFYMTTVTVQSGKNKGSQDFYVSKDGAYLIQGTVYGLNGDPAKQVEAEISLKDQPAAGPVSAPVTIVEYADLECPMCAQMQQFLEKQLLPKYGNKVRIVFKEYPLFNIHPWAVQAAVANECAYQIDPAHFVAFRSLIFQNQNTIKVATVRQQLLDFGEQAGLDKEKLAACYDSKASLPRVQQDFLEGQKLGVNSTPTFFINGKMLPGAADPAAFYKMVDDALAKAAAK